MKMNLWDRLSAHLTPFQLRLIGQPGLLQILPDHGNGLLALVYNDGLRSPPAQRLDGQLAAAAEEIQHPAALDLKLNDIKDRFLEPIRRGSGIQSLRSL